MRNAAKIRPWLSVATMFQWMQDAPDESSYRRRMAIWLTHTGRLHARKVAEILSVSVQAVWLWTCQYNARGPEGLDRVGRGGRRWGFFAPAEEGALLRPFLRRARSGNPPAIAEIQSTIEAHLGGNVSRSYVYRLLRRHGWYKILAETAVEVERNSFQAIAQPWRRRR